MKELEKEEESEGVREGARNLFPMRGLGMLTGKTRLWRLAKLPRLVLDGDSGACTQNGRRCITTVRTG